MALARLAIRAAWAQRSGAAPARAFHSLEQAWRTAPRPAPSAWSCLRQPGAQARPSLWSRGFATADKAGGAAPSPTAAGALQAVTAGVKGALAKFPGTAYGLLPAQARNLVDSSTRPGAAQRVLSLQLNAFWQRHGTKVYIAAGVFAAYALWRTMYGIASTFINLSETMAAGGFLALSASMVILTALYIRRKHTVDPATVHRLAMYRLNTHPGVLEVMGAPLVSSDLRASVLTGGKLKFKGLRPKYQSRRVQMIFPLQGSDRRGLVSIEAKKRNGKYLMKLIAVDVPTAAGDDQRIFIEGGPTLYQRGGILSELRDPFLRAVAAEDHFEREDEADDAAEAAAEARGDKASAVGESGGGMYFWERASLAIQRTVASLRRRSQAPPAVPGTKASASA